MEDENAATSSPDQEPEVEQAPLVGKTRRLVYSLTLLVSFSLLTILGALVANGAIGIAATLPGTFNIKATTITGTGFQITPSIFNGQAVAVNTLTTATITNQTITKTIPFGSNVVVTVTITSGGGSGGPATASNLVTDIINQGADSATLTNFQLSDVNQGIDVVQQAADSATLTNVSIDSPFLSASSITLPNLSLSVSVSVTGQSHSHP
ncbi:MAG TPA: DUF6230 family protein [Ktedonosporobacter sp.]|jgi:hypothetical protein|nr:DUF6230 family protein [Ktedonosporobacter sp.]